MLDEAKLLLAIVATTLAKWLMTDTGGTETETPAETRRRRRRAFGGIIAGVVLGYFGSERLVALAPGLTPDDRVVAAIVLAITGEHAMRWLMGLGPDTFTRIVRYIFRVEDK